MRYYYGQLSRPLQGVYDALLGGFRALAPGIRIPMLDEKQLADVYLRLKLDEPLLFYVTGYRCRWMTGAAHMELLPEYLFDKAKIRTHQQAVSARLARLTKPLEGKTEAEKELAVHDFILENVRYDKLKKPYSHEILGPMTQGVGVCEGIAKTVKVLCDQLGLWCIVALSEADPRAGSNTATHGMSCASAGSITTSTRRLTTRSSGAKSGMIIITSTTAGSSATTNGSSCPSPPARMGNAFTIEASRSRSRRSWKSGLRRHCAKSSPCSCSTGAAAA